MIQDEIDMIIERLKNACTYHRFDEPGVMVEYARILGKYKYRLMDRAIDKVLEEDSRNVPSISVLVKAYRKEEGAVRGIEVKNEKYCDVCDDNGFILMTEMKRVEGYDLPYQYVLYCPFCDVGRAQAYDGSQCKDHKSPYRVPPLTEFFDDEGIQAMRETNREKRVKNTEAVRPIKKELQSVGKNIPRGWEYDVDDVPF